MPGLIFASTPFTAWWTSTRTIVSKSSHMCSLTIYIYVMIMLCYKVWLESFSNNNRLGRQVIVWYNGSFWWWNRLVIFKAIHFLIFLYLISSNGSGPDNWRQPHIWYININNKIYQYLILSETQRINICKLSHTYDILIDSPVLAFLLFIVCIMFHPLKHLLLQHLHFADP